MILAVILVAVSKQPNPVPDLLSEALNHERAGRLDEAIRVYDRVLEIQPGHAWALEGRYKAVKSRHERIEAEREEARRRARMEGEAKARADRTRPKAKPE